jgi:hypothetical protein
LGWAREVEMVLMGDRIYRDNEISVLRKGWPPTEVDDPEYLVERPTFTKDTGYYADDVEILG